MKPATKGELEAAPTRWHTSGLCHPPEDRRAWLTLRFKIRGRWWFWPGYRGGKPVRHLAARGGSHLPLDDDGVEYVNRIIHHKSGPPGSYVGPT